MKMGVAFGGQIQDAVNAHMATFQECKPRQEGGTVRMAASEQPASGAMRCEA